mmetsp:Transcript_45362/g.131329  ORF Transcript_45362/g.131329 Transcript_45362/m.131329 type:complete len:229 (+) Transcript_45362:480-1166(+)
MRLGVVSVEAAHGLLVGAAQHVDHPAGGHGRAAPEALRPQQPRQGLPAARGGVVALGLVKFPLPAFRLVQPSKDVQPPFTASCGPVRARRVHGRAARPLERGWLKAVNSVNRAVEEAATPCNIDAAIQDRCSPARVEPRAPTRTAWQLLPLPRSRICAAQGEVAGVRLTNHQQRGRWQEVRQRPQGRAEGAGAGARDGGGRRRGEAGGEGHSQCDLWNLEHYANTKAK